MSDNQNRGNVDFARYDSMATEELEEILRLDAEMPDGQESDTDKILYIMEVLAERKRNNSHTGNTALEAYESFKQNYMPETDHPIIPMKTKRRGLRWVRSLTAAAVVLAILLVSSVTAKAFGFNIWQAVIQWTQETFHFGNWGNSNTENNLPYVSFQEALEKSNTPSWIVPTYIPEEFSLADIKVEQTPAKKRYTVKYTSGDQMLRVIVQDHLDGKPIYVEQSDGLVEEYTASGITFYLFENNKRTQAVWIVDSYECRITGELTIDTLKRMINSIEKG